MKTIELTQGKIALIDDEDFERVSQFKWFARRYKHLYYVAHGLYLGKIDGKYKTRIIHLHQFILGVDGIKVDHRNGDTLDNRKQNLRLATIGQNNTNLHRLKSNNTSGYRGVIKRKDSKNEYIWRARISDLNGKKKTLGQFKTPEEAAKAFDLAAKELYGDFCGKLNFE